MKGILLIPALTVFLIPFAAKWTEIWYRTFDGYVLAETMMIVGGFIFYTAWLVVIGISFYVLAMPTEIEHPPK